MFLPPFSRAPFFRPLLDQGTGTWQSDALVNAIPYELDARPRTPHAPLRLARLPDHASFLPSPKVFLFRLRQRTWSGFLSLNSQSVRYPRPSQAHLVREIWKPATRSRAPPRWPSLANTFRACNGQRVSPHAPQPRTKRSPCAHTRCLRSWTQAYESQIPGLVREYRL